MLVRFVQCVQNIWWKLSCFRAVTRFTWPAYRFVYASGGCYRCLCRRGQNCEHLCHYVVRHLTLLPAGGSKHRARLTLIQRLKLWPSLCAMAFASCGAKVG